jgi:hypothetical protein
MNSAARLRPSSSFEICDDIEAISSMRPLPAVAAIGCDNVVTMVPRAVEIIAAL